MDLGFKQAGYDIIWAIDNEENAVETYKKNIGDHIILGDINKIDLNEIPNADIVMVVDRHVNHFRLLAKKEMLKMLEGN